jgi:diadenosine tetraphosphate (Ap4A) HIT family hydrolase
MNICRLCPELATNASVKAWNTPLFESLNFVALPSVGALVEGWLLLAPKRHFISLGALPDPLLPEMGEFKEFLCSVLTQCYGTVTAFEHGPSAAGRTLGCGVDHAHLHLVPVAFDLSNEVSPLMPKGATWTPAGIDDCRAAYLRRADYLYLEQPIGSGRIATHESFGSQLFRRAVASHIGAPHRYNWREFEQLPTVMATIRRIRKWHEENGASESVLSHLVA